MDAAWRIELFGGLRAERDGRAVTHFETRKTAALLAYLAFYLHRSHPRELLIEVLWPEEVQEATRPRLRQAVSVLRRALEPQGTQPGSVLLAEHASVQLAPGAVTTDVAEFESGVRRAERVDDPAERAAILRAAVDGYRGDLLLGFYEEWIGPERQRLRDAHIRALGLLGEALAAGGDLAGAIEAARRAVSADPLREEAQRDLIGLYAATQRNSEALRRYQELTRILKQELNAAPSAASRALVEAIAGGGAVPLHSPFYIVRPTDAEFAAAVTRGDSIVLVKGPRQVAVRWLNRGKRNRRTGGGRGEPRSEQGCGGTDAPNPG